MSIKPGCFGSDWQYRRKQVWYFISKNQPGLWPSDPFKSSPGSHSLLVSDSVGTTSSCLLLAFPLLVSLALSRLCCLYFLAFISKAGMESRQVSGVMDQNSPCFKPVSLLLNLTFEFELWVCQVKPYRTPKHIFFIQVCTIDWTNPSFNLLVRDLLRLTWCDCKSLPILYIPSCIITSKISTHSNAVPIQILKSTYVQLIC